MSRVPQIRRRARWRCALLTMAMTASIMAAGLPAGQGGAAAYAAEEDTVSEPQPLLVVAPESPVVTNDASEFRFEVLLKNPGESALDAGAVVLTIDSQRAENPEDLQYPSERDALELTQVDVLETPPGEDQRVEVSVARDDFPLLFTRAPGVYPVHAEFNPAGFTDAAGAGAAAIGSEDLGAGVGAEGVAGDETAAATDADAGLTPAEEPSMNASTALIWNGIDTVSSIPLTLVVPIVLPSDVHTLPTREELNQHSSRLLQVFDAAEQRHATIAVDPRILAGIRSLGTAAPGGATELLERIERSTAPIFLLQFADADPAVQAALGFTELMQPVGLSYATALGAFLPPASQAEAPAESDSMLSDGTTVGQGTGAANSTDETSAAADTPDETEIAETEAPVVDPLTGVPTPAGLLTLKNSRPGAWPAGGEVDSATLSLLQAAGLTSIVLDSSNVSNATSPRVAMGDFDALIADAATGAAARTAMSGETATEQSAGVADLTVRLALGAQNNVGGAVLALDRGAVGDMTDPLRIFQIIDDIEWIQTTSERQQSVGTATLRSGAPTEERRELLRATLLRSAQIDELAPLLEQPDYLLEYQRERVLEALATRYAEPGIDFADVDAATKKRDDELLQGVQPIVTESTQLVGTLSNVPVTLGNALPFEALISLRVNPTSAGIALTKREFEVRIPATGSKAVLVPVQSRISSGESSLALTVYDRWGEESFATAQLPLTLRTAIETILMWVLGSAAALLLGFGIFRSIRRKRAVKAKKDAADHSSEPLDNSIEAGTT